VELVTPEGTEGFSDGFDNFESVNEDKEEYLSSENKEKENTNPSLEPSEPSAFPPKCYRCDFSNYNTKGEYEYHCVTKHPGLPGYPGPADIRESGLTPQGMPWET
jgi:hypothetical protein